jgi:hypothetical protein
MGLNNNNPCTIQSFNQNIIISSFAKIPTQLSLYWCESSSDCIQQRCVWFHGLVSARQRANCDATDHFLYTVIMLEKFREVIDLV